MPDDPFAVLGVTSRASAEELAAAHRALAKRLHPDRAGGSERGARMAEVNAAYDLAREMLFGGVLEQAERRAAASRPASRRLRPAGHWLEESMRVAVGPELLLLLAPDEEVRLITSAATWSSAQTRLALTRGRLLWLLDDAVLGRTRMLRLRDVVSADLRLAWPARRRGILRLRERDGRRHAFAELDPAHGRAIVRAIEATRGG